MDCFGKTYDSLSDKLCFLPLNAKGNQQIIGRKKKGIKYTKFKIKDKNKNTIVSATKIILIRIIFLLCILLTSNLLLIK